MVGAVEWCALPREAHAGHFAAVGEGSAEEEREEPRVGKVGGGVRPQPAHGRVDARKARRRGEGDQVGHQMRVELDTERRRVLSLHRVLYISQTISVVGRVVSLVASCACRVVRWTYGGR